MARVPGADAVYDAANSFRHSCLTTYRSLLWPVVGAWTLSNISALWDSFMTHPDRSEQSFFEKWKGQLTNEPADVHRVAADVLAFYYLFHSRTKATTKLDRVSEVIRWKLSSDVPNLSQIARAYDHPLGNAGIHYNTALTFQIAFYLEFAKRVKADSGDVNDRNYCRRIADEL